MFSTKHEKRSFIITSIIYILLVLILFLSGLKYLDPPPESGIAVNFGTTETGAGDVQTEEPVASSPQENIPESAPQETETTSSEETVTEDVVTQDSEDAPVIEEEEEEKETPEEEPEEEEKETEQEVEETPEETNDEAEEQVEEEPDPQPDQNVTDAMSNVFSDEEQDGVEGSEGDDNSPGDKGDPDGDPDASSYYGTGTGLDGDGNYKLGGRKALNKTKYTQECNETGTVVVRIEVNQNGEVIRAKAGVRGTTNSSRCLLEPAERAARETNFNNDTNAPSRQVGYITYEFRLSE
ncbi:MAG: energy transducer TonB [Bacteroidota bacterium]